MNDTVEKTGDLRGQWTQIISDVCEQIFLLHGLKLPLATTRNRVRTHGNISVVAKVTQAPRVRFTGMTHDTILGRIL